MGFIENLKAKAKDLKKQITAIYYVSQDRRVGILPKVLIAVTILYALSPIDLIPDFIPILGYLDDLIIVPALIALTIRLIPAEIWTEAKNRAVNEPKKLKKNWTFAVFFVFLWILVLWWVGYSVYEMLV